jgi:hypothetical protein
VLPHRNGRLAQNPAPLLPKVKMVRAKRADPKNKSKPYSNFDSNVNACPQEICEE